MYSGLVSNFKMLVPSANLAKSNKEVSSNYIYEMGAKFVQYYCYHF